MPTRPWGESWYRNVPFWILLIVILIVALVGAYTYTAFRRAAIDLVLERDQQLAVLSAARLHEELMNFASTLESLAHSSEMSDGNIHDQSKALWSASFRLAVFDGGVVLLDERGVVSATQPNRVDILGQDWSDRAYFQAVLGEAHMFVSDAVADGADESLVITISVPIYREQSEFVGALVGMFRLGEPTLSAFYASIVRLRLGQSGGTYIIDGTGRILYDSETNRAGEFVAKEQLPPLASADSAGVALTEDPAGHEIVAAYAPVPNASWLLLTEDDWAVLTSSTRRYSRILLLSFAVALALPPLSLAILTRQKRFPLLQSSLPSRGEIIAREIHRELHRKSLPTLPGWTLVQRNKAGREGGREFFDACILIDGRLMLSMGRVDANGIHAGLALASTRAALRTAALQGLDPCEALQQCNCVLCAEYAQPINVCCLYILLDPSTGALEYSSAGPVRPYFYGKNWRLEPQLPGTPMGLTPDLHCEKRERTLERGEALIVLSESIADVEDEGGQVFAEFQLVKILQGRHRSAEELADAIQAVVKRTSQNGRGHMEETNLLVLMRSDQEQLDSAQVIGTSDNAEKS